MSVCLSDRIEQLGSQWAEFHEVCFVSRGKDKGKVHPSTGHESPEGEQRYSSTLLLTSALGGKDPVPTALEDGWAPGPIWIGAENLAPPGFDTRTVQPVASRYTD
jgi:hypothetical protein